MADGKMKTETVCELKLLVKHLSRFETAEGMLQCELHRCGLGATGKEKSCPAACPNARLTEAERRIATASATFAELGGEVCVVTLDDGGLETRAGGLAARKPKPIAARFKNDLKAIFSDQRDRPFTGASHMAWAIGKDRKGVWRHWGRFVTTALDEEIEQRLTAYNRGDGSAPGWRRVRIQRAIPLDIALREALIPGVTVVEDCWKGDRLRRSVVGDELPDRRLVRERVQWLESGRTSDLFFEHGIEKLKARRSSGSRQP